MSSQGHETGTFLTPELAARITTAYDIKLYPWPADAAALPIEFQYAQMSNLLGNSLPGDAFFYEDKGFGAQDMQPELTSEQNQARIMQLDEQEREPLLRKQQRDLMAEHDAQRVSALEFAFMSGAVSGFHFVRADQPNSFKQLAVHSAGASSMDELASSKLEGMQAAAASLRAARVYAASQALTGWAVTHLEEAEALVGYTPDKMKLVLMWDPSYHAELSALLAAMGLWLADKPVIRPLSREQYARETAAWLVQRMLRHPDGVANGDTDLP